MISMDGTLGIAFLLQTGLGVFGNAILFVCCAHIFTVEYQTEAHMLHNNPLILGSYVTSLYYTQGYSGIPEAGAALGFRTLMDNIICKANTYLHRVSHGLSTCLTSLLSILQAITMGPGRSYWAAFKARNPLYIFYSFIFIWMLNLLISSNLIISVTVLRNGSLSRVIVKSCFILEMDDLTR